MNKKSDIGFNPFSIKSSFIISLAGILTCFVIPNIVMLVGIDAKIVTLLANLTILPFVVAYTRHFIDGDDGYNKKFLRTFIILSLSFGLITFYWLYLQIFI